MEHTYTEIKLVQFIYGECDLLEKLEIEDAIENDTFTRESYLSLLEGHRMMPKVKFSPSSRTIESILAYSKNRCGAEC